MCIAQRSGERSAAFIKGTNGAPVSAAVKRELRIQIRETIYRALTLVAGIGFLTGVTPDTKAETVQIYQKFSDEDSQTRKSIDAYIREYSAGNIEGARQSLAALVRREPNNIAALEALGLVRANEGQFTQALPLLERAYHFRPKSLIALTNLGDVYLRLQRFSDARRIFCFATKLAPESAQSQARYGEALMGLSLYTAASEAFGIAVKLSPDTGDYRYNLALSLYSAKSFAKARQVLDDFSDKDNSAPAQALWADIEEQQGHISEAIQHYHAAASLSESAGNIHALGLELLRHGMFVAAKKVYDYGRSLFPEDSEMEIGWALAEYGNNEFETAATDFSRLLEKSPENGVFLSMFEESCKAMMGQAPPACKSLITLAAQHPERERLALAAVSYLLKYPDSQAEDLGTADHLLQSASRSGAASAEFYYLSGVLAQERMLWDNSIASFKEAIRLNPVYPEAHYRLAQAFYRLGRREDGAREIAIFQRENERVRDARGETERSEDARP